jgi:tape measure domain-containing protein
MAVSSATELKILIKTAGEKNLDRLARQLEGVGKNTTSADFKFDKFSRSLKRQEQQAVRNISNLRTFSGAWRELANSVDYTSEQFREANREAQRLERQLAKTQQAGRGGGLARVARTGGAIAAAGIFGGPEGAIGAGIGAIAGGPVGAAVGGAIGAQVGGFRQQLGATAAYAADLQKQRLALKLVTKDAAEYRRALQFIATTSKELAIPQDILTRQFTKLSASVIGAGGDVAETETAFKGIAAGIRGTGGSLQDLDSALTATSQVFSKGKVSAEELRQQIGERLPGAFTLFAESLEMTPAELDKALEKGEVSLKDFQTFAVKIFKEYGLSAKIIADSPAAAGDRLKTALSNLSASVGTLLQPIGAAFQTTFANIANAISGAADELNRFFGIAGEAKMRKITDALQREAATLTRLENKRKAIKESPSMKERAMGIEPETLFLDRQIRQAQANFDRLQQELFGLQAINRATQFGKKDKPKGLPAAIPGVSSASDLKETKQLSDEIIALYKSFYGTTNEYERIQIQYAIDQQKIQDDELTGNNKIKAQLDAEEKLRISLVRLGNGAGKGLAKQLTAQKEIKKELTETQVLGQQIVTTFAQGMGDALLNLFDRAKSFRELLGDLLRQTAKLILNFGLQAATKGIFPGLFPQAMGGIMTGSGPVPLKKYAKGGIAYGPQMALFGEGSTPEAYVPLPDGRSIPVKMKGEGAGESKVVVNVDASGSNVQGNGNQASQLGKAIGAAVQQELIKQKKPGGLLA